MAADRSLVLISWDTDPVKLSSSLGCTRRPAPAGAGGGCRSFRLGFGFVFAQRVPAQLDPVGVVNNAVQDRVAQGRISDDGVPVGHWDLTGDQQRLPAVAFLDDLQQVAALVRTERFRPPIID